MQGNKRMHHTRNRERASKQRLRVDRVCTYGAGAERGSERETRLADEEETSEALNGAGASADNATRWLLHSQFYLRLPQATAATPTPARQPGNFESFSRRARK